MYSQFIADTVESGWLASEISRVSALIRPYVEADANTFYSAEAFDTAVEALQSYCALRGESVRGQLEGTIPSTSEGQRANDSALVDAGTLSISDMGVMNTGGGGPGGDKAPSMPGGDMLSSGASGFPVPPSGFQAPGDSAGDDQKEADQPQTGNLSDGDSKPSFPDMQPQAGPQEMPESGFLGERARNSGVSQTAWITFGACLALLLAASFATAKSRGHNG